MKSIDYIFFDVANTLLHKPELWIKIQDAFTLNGYDIPQEEIFSKHKFLSEVIKFPDTTSAEFYQNFNTELCLSLGIIPSDKLLSDIFSNCTYLKWEPFSDVSALANIDVPIGIISNWDSSLKEKLSSHVNIDFQHIIGSKDSGFSKPDKRIFDKAWELIGRDKKNILYVGDSLKLDMTPALEIGWQVRLIDRHNLYSNFEYKISSLTEIV